MNEAAALTAMAYVDLDPIRAGIAETPEASDFTSGQQRIEAWQSQHESLSNDENTPEPDDTNLSDATIVNLLEFSDDSKERAEDAIPYSTSDYLELVDWSGRAIFEAREGLSPPSNCGSRAVRCSRPAEKALGACRI